MVDELRGSELDLGRGSIMGHAKSNQDSEQGAKTEGSQANAHSLGLSGVFTEVPKTAKPDSEKGIFPDEVQDSEIVDELRKSELGDDQAQVCTSCGHGADSKLCCQAQAHSRRTGERQRQEKRKLEEAAAVRPRHIPAVDEATTPAQRIMAGIKERLAKAAKTDSSLT